MSRLLRFKVFRGRVLQGADLPLTLFEILFCQDCNAINLEIHGTGFWKGHRNWAVDGCQGNPGLHPSLVERPLQGR